MPIAPPLHQMREHAALEKLEQNHELIAALQESRRMAGSEKHRNRIDALLNDVDAAGAPCALARPFARL